MTRVDIQDKLADLRLQKAKLEKELEDRENLEKGIMLKDNPRPMSFRSADIIRSELNTILFLLNTGLRREEGLRLRRNNVDLAQGVIHITKTKDKEERTIPLTKRAIEILDVVEDEVFSSLRKEYVSHQFKSIARSAGLEGFKLHSLRHTFSVRLIESGADILVVSKLLGHSDIKTSMIYAKAGNAIKKRAIERLEEFQNGHNRLLEATEGR